MAISPMAKILIACHKSQASQLLEALQQSGLCQVLNAEETMVSKQYPDLTPAGERPRHLEEKRDTISMSIEFLGHYAKPKGLAAALAPKVEIDSNNYLGVVEDKNVEKLASKSLEVRSQIDKLQSEIEDTKNTLGFLQPWRPLDIKLEELNTLEKTRCFAGILTTNKLADVKGALADMETAIEEISESGTRVAVLVACMKEKAGDVHKLLRSADFEQANFEGIKGTAAKLIGQNEKVLADKQSALKEQQQKAKELAGDIIKLQILYDYYSNLLQRETTGNDCPATEQTVIFEGWVRKKNYKKLKQIVSGFDAAQVSEIQPAEGEEIPVEIENKKIIRPFEVVTRLYGMPENYSLDPTVFLAPFFALFFGICLTDAGYGIVMTLLFWWFLRKFQGDKKAFKMLVICSIMVIITGALTGGWFSDTIQMLIPQNTAVGQFLAEARSKIMLFDPMEKPMIFFAVSLSLGYIQVMFGIFVAFFHNISKKDYIAAICDQLTWIIFLNSLLLFAFSKMGYLPQVFGKILIILAIMQAVVILLFSERKGGWGARIGMGAFQLFGTVFYFGDVLSYVRLMALGMVTGGFGMAVNVIVKLLMDAGPIGWIFGAIVFVLLHSVNIALSTLSAFVHTLRLQYVEFFPKFFEGGGRKFKPLSKENKYVIVKD